MTTLRILLATLDEASEPDDSRCSRCGRKVTRVETDRDVFWSDESGDADCYWNGGTYGYYTWHSAGWVDKDRIAAIERQIVAAVRALPDEVLDREVPGS